jgi:hypothetical protein
MTGKRGVDAEMPQHRCPATGCKIPVDADKLMCGPHWAMVPGPLQKAVYRAWDHGNGSGTAAHVHAMDYAIGAVNRKLAGR